MSALTRWREELEGWAIPDEILAAAPESPWSFPTELFRRRAEAAPTDTPSFRRAREALPEGGTVLDVGSGAGAASLPLVPPASLLVAVDQSEDMLASLEELAAARRVRVLTVVGSWPDVAEQVPETDIVVCHHVLYNAAELGPFVRALSDRSGRRVVAEITDRHPLAWTGELWRRFHGLDRPDGPTADDAVEALRELGVAVRREDFDPPEIPAGFGRREDAIGFVRRRLCLTADRDGEIADAVGHLLVERDGLWSLRPPGRRLVTLWWDV